MPSLPGGNPRSNIVLNQLAGLYGDPAIAAFSITARVMMLANSALIGFGQGFQPVRFTLSKTLLKGKNSFGSA